MLQTTTHEVQGQSATMAPLVTRDHHDVRIAGTTVRADMTGRGATLTVGEAGAQTTIEITPTGPLPGDYFVGTFNGPRIVALVRLSDDYDTVQEIDLIHMVEAQKDVAGFPRIGVVETGGSKQLEVVGGGARARLELYELPIP